MKDKKKFRKNVDIYKPNGKQTGSVAQFSLGSENECMFLECAKQCGPKDSSKPYDWAKKIVVKLGLPDISKMLAYLKLDKPGAALKLFHQSPSGGNKSVELKYQEFKGRPSYYLSVSYQKPGGGQAERVSVPIGLDEIEILKIAFTMAIEVILDWRTPVPNYSKQ